ncbi:histidine phosphatase family protein [Kitasatospora sp. NPDC059747]|uniref:histidine phosphatase family protein n=1 Tax=Kitasatospora sp. NPDC059747 TaxID=3346930 RepID=UPI00364D1A6A
MTSPLSRRTLLTGLTAVVPVLLTGCSSNSKSDSKKAAKAANATAARASDPGGDAFVMIIRHGEKPDGSTPGLDENGKHDSKSLTERGWSRAKALPRLFDPPATGLRKPARIYAASDQGPLAGAHRMRQTVTPLGAALGLKVDITYAESQETELAGAVLTGAQPVLISWEHGRIPRIVEALGATGSGAPAVWPDRFDLVWVFSRTAGGPWTFQEVHQHLLDGDS